jgi:chlorobactene glucosyltransferase
MLLFILCFLWAVGIAWLLLRATRQYRHYQQVRPQTGQTRLPSLSVIVPTRNEAQKIGRCLRSLLAQRYPGEFQIVVVDDDSTDDTAAVVRAVSAGVSSAGIAERLELKEAGPLPAGWTGKPHACWRGASGQRAEWLLFCDADTVAEPELLATAVAAALERRLDMLSLEPFQELGSLWERLVVPAGFFVLAFSQDLGRVNDPHSREAVANGQFILLRRGVYEALGGHRTVRGEVCEDRALARRVKAAGYRLAVLGAGKLLRTRMYTGFGSLWEGLSKNAVETIGGMHQTVMAGILGLALAWAAPLLPLAAALALRRPPAGGLEPWALTLALVGSLALLGTHLGIARYLRIPLACGLLFPLGYTLGSAIAFAAVWKRARGRVSWKGRVYTSRDP